MIEERGAEEALAEAAQNVIIAARNGGDPEPRRGARDRRRPCRRGALWRADGGRLPASAASCAERWPSGHAGLRRKLSAALSLADETTTETLIAAFCAEGAGDEAALRAAAAALAAGSPADCDRGAMIAAWCAAEPQPPAADAGGLRKRLYLTEKGEIRKR